MFESSCIVDYADSQTDVGDTDRFLQYMEKSTALDAALTTGPEEYRAKTVAPTVDSSVTNRCRQMQSDGVLALTRISAGPGRSRVRLQYRAALPSAAESFLSTWSHGELTQVPIHDSADTQLETLDTVLLLKTKSESRIFDLRAKLFDIPANQTARWVEGVGLISTNKIRWDQLKAEANQLHDRKAMLNEKLIEIQASSSIKIIDDQKTIEMQSNAIGQDVPVGSQDGNPTDGLSLAEKTNYLQAEIDLIFEQHLEISHQMRAIASTVDLEEQVAFEEFTLRRELEQELKIRDALLARISLPQQSIPSSNIRIESISEVSTAVQVSPHLFWHLTIGGVIGGCLFGFPTLFVCIVGLDE